jgi:hypothetical protein
VNSEKEDEGFPIREKEYIKSCPAVFKAKAIPVYPLPLHIAVKRFQTINLHFLFSFY